MAPCHGILSLCMPVSCQPALINGCCVLSPAAMSCCICPSNVFHFSRSLLSPLLISVLSPSFSLPSPSLFLTPIHTFFLFMGIVERLNQVLIMAKLHSSSPLRSKWALFSFVVRKEKN